MIKSNLYFEKLKYLVSYHYPVTSGFNSNNNSKTTYALCYPNLPNGVKKLFSASSSVIILSSTTTIVPTPGNTKLFNVSTPAGSQLF